MNSLQVIESWESVGIHVNPNSTNVKTLCPACSEQRKNKRDKCLSVSAVNGVGNCHNCGTSYVVRKERHPNKVYTKPELKELPLSDKIKKFFKDRGIEERTLEYFKISESKEWMYEKDDYKEGETMCIDFPYYEKNELVNVKFRASGKRFRMVGGAKLIFFNLKSIENSDVCSIVEGEIDCMTAYQCGVYSVVSVPNGASKGSLNLDYLDNCLNHFNGKKKIIIATDDDPAGWGVRDELVRRLGRERCLMVEYPEGCKDANEVLLKHGAKAVKKMFDEAKELPVEGIVLSESLVSGIMEYYTNGFPKGLSIGYKNFDQLLTFRGGELTVVTGIPGSGKSNIIDQFMVRLASRFGWRCGVFSPEHQPCALHALSLATMFLGEKTIGRDKVSQMKMDRGVSFIDDHFFFMKVDEIDITIDGILALAKELVVKKGIKALVIDPYNYIEHNVPKGYSETQYISELLTKLCNFLRLYDVHGFLVAHPTKIQKDKKTGKYNVPTMYDIAGSSHFFNKAYNGLSVYRDFDTNEITVYVQKVKFKFIGKVGSASFKYDIPTGRYAEIFDDKFENEFQMHLQSQSQPELFIPPEREDPPAREPGQLTDINKLPIPDSFDYQPRDTAPF